MATDKNSVAQLKTGQANQFDEIGLFGEEERQRGTEEKEGGGKGWRRRKCGKESSCRCSPKEAGLIKFRETETGAALTKGTEPSQLGLEGGRSDHTHR